MSRNRARGQILICLVVSLLATPLTAEGQAGASTSSQRRDVDPKLVSRYFQRILELMPDGKEKEDFKGEDAQDWVGYGVETCRVLGRGTPDQYIRRDVCSFFGADLGNAIVDAAKDVLCPSHK